MSATGSGRPLAEAGFTLLELLVTVGIMALVAGIAFPLLQHRLAAGAADRAAATVELALAQARGDALATGVAVTVVLAPDRSRLAFANGRAPLVLPGDGPTIDWPRDGMTFHPDGSANGGTATLALGTRVRRLSVDPDTGRVDQSAGTVRP